MIVSLLGLDVGTTHCKAGLFAPDGKALNITSRPTPVHQALAGWFFIDPEELWETICTAIREAATAAQAVGIASVGIASMAETGLLVEKKTGAPRSVFVPWFDTSAAPQAKRLAQAEPALDGFSRSGIRPKFKCSLAKLLWLRETQGAVLEDVTWLSVADYIAYRLTGVMRSEYSLAGRTYAFDIQRKGWDAAWLERLGLDPGIFPPVGPATEPVGACLASNWQDTLLPQGIPVSICGHDHMAAAFGASAVLPGRVLDSMGTAEGLTGALDERPLGEEELRSGLSYGCHVVPGRMYWMGGLYTSGGSVEWLRSLLGEPPLSYAELETYLNCCSAVPGEILYFPYLAGSGSPHTDPQVRGAFIGLDARHTRADLIKAVLEGTAFEMEFVRQVGERVTGREIRSLTAAGGGTRLQAWVQIKADVSACRIEIPEMDESTLLGAALLAGVAGGIYRSVDEVQSLLASQPHRAILPDMERHARYQKIFETGYLAFQKPLRQWKVW